MCLVGRVSFNRGGVFVPAPPRLLEFYFAPSRDRPLRRRGLGSNGTVNRLKTEKATLTTGCANSVFKFDKITLSGINQTLIVNTCFSNQLKAYCALSEASTIVFGKTRD